MVRVGAVNPPSKADNTFLIYENCSSTGDWVAGGSGITNSGGICSLSGDGYAHKEFNTGYVSLNGSMVSYTAKASAYIFMILSPGTGGGTWDIEPAENIAYLICPEGNSYIIIYNANSGANVEDKKRSTGYG